MKDPGIRISEKHGVVFIPDDVWQAWGLNEASASA